MSRFQLIGAKRGAAGWAPGMAMDSEDTVRFSVLTGVRAMIEKYPLARVNEVYERMTSGKAEF